MKRIIAILCVTLLLAGCSLSGEEANTQILDVRTSYFESRRQELTDTARLVSGRVAQKEDGNTVAVKVHAAES